MHDPRPLKFLFHSPSEDKKRLSGIIGRMIPYRIGIEFELFGTLANLVPNLSNEDDINKAIKTKFNLYDYSEDLYNQWNQSKELKGELNEIRVSIKGVKQLNSLWNILLALRQNCKIPAERGGIHIHIDYQDFIDKYDNSYDAKKLAKSYFNQNSVLAKIINIFGGYKGKYNSRGSDINAKSYWINISNKNSIEFRIGKLTFDYQTIIRWIVQLSKLVTESKFHNCDQLDISTHSNKSTEIVNINSHLNNYIDNYMDYVRVYRGERGTNIYYSADLGTTGSSYNRLTELV